jgi:glycosyltransferase involved in cell wall biosynthesis
MESAMAELMPRPRLLFLCQTLPFPPDGGVWIRTYHVLRLLSEAFEVTALCFERSATAGASGEQARAAGRDGLRALAAVEAFEIPQRHSRVRFLYDHARSALLRRVYTTYVYDSRAFRHRLAELLESTPFDLVHVDSLDLARYLPACESLPVVCVHHDIESALLRRRAAVQHSVWRRAYFLYQSERMEEVERRWCPRVALNVTCSDHDRDRLQRISPGSRVAVVPNGVDTEEFRPAAAGGTSIAYVGGTNPFPNLDALQFFAADVLPHLRIDHTTPMKWIGRASPEQQRAYAQQYGIELTGYVEDVRPLLRDAACHIVPLRVGGGTRLKILNSWAMGKPVVSTSVGCEGLAAVDGENLLIRDEPAAFAEAIVRVLNDPALARRLGEGGRATAERLYSWNVVGERMIDAYLALANAESRNVVAAPRGERARYAHGLR